MELIDYCMRHGIDFMFYYEKETNSILFNFIKENKTLKLDYNRAEYIHISSHCNIEDYIIEKLKKEFHHE